MFQRTQAINKLLALKKRVSVIPGGTSAGKTFGIIPILIDIAIKVPKSEISIVSESVPHLRRGAIKDFIKIMQETERYEGPRWNKTNLIYNFANGSYIEFFSTDNGDKCRGARRHFLFMNEANNCTWDAFYQLAIRTSKRIWVDFNPSNEFWAHTELPPDKDTDWLTLTYKDNGALEQSIVKEIEKALVKGFHDPSRADLFAKDNIKNAYWANWWKVYGLGQLGVLEGVIFQNWRIVDSLPDQAKYLGTGIDFGYTNDPTSLIDLYKLDDQPIFDEVCYQTGLKNSDIARILKQHGRGQKDCVVADSSEPKSIDEVNDFGFSVEGAEKGPDSVRFGIDTMQERPFLVTKRSVNMIRELRKYSWDQDKNGKPLNVPVDAFNHTIDAARYIYVKKYANKNQIDESQIKKALDKALDYLG